MTIYGCGADYETDAGETKKYCETVDPTCNNDQGWKDCSVSENQAAMEAEAAKAAAAAAAAVTTYSKKSSGTCATSIPKDKCVKAEKYIGIYGNAGRRTAGRNHRPRLAAWNTKATFTGTRTRTAMNVVRTPSTAHALTRTPEKTAGANEGNGKARSKIRARRSLAAADASKTRVDDIKTYLDMNPERKDVVYSGASMFKVMAHILDDWNAKDRCETVDPTCATPEADQSEDTRGWGSEGLEILRQKPREPPVLLQRPGVSTVQPGQREVAGLLQYLQQQNQRQQYPRVLHGRPKRFRDGSWIYCLPTDCPSETHYIREKGDGFECAKRSTEEELNCPEGTTFYTRAGYRWTTSVGATCTATTT